MSFKLSSVELGFIRLFSLIEKTRVTRYVYVWAAAVMSWKFVGWAWRFAETSTRTGSDIALIIGAIGVPLSAFTGFAFKHYLESTASMLPTYSATSTTTVEEKK